MKSNFVIGITGGSGCGKSTLSYSLRENFSEQIEVVHFDDYQREEAAVPFLKGMRNWDHPDAVDFDSLFADLTNLINGNSVKVMTKSRVLNPTYEEKGRITHVLKPKKIIIVEGYMAFTILE